MDQIVSVGRRKRAVARVFFKQSPGSFHINKRELTDFFPLEIHRIKMLEPFSVLEINPSDFDISVNVIGGGITGQAEAIRLGLARALIETNEEYRGPLKKAGLLTRDARKVERKKYGKKKARKSTQFSKR
ncbi:MAG: 30S ribosomal protein S9 [Bacteroidetes bacterium]|nr:MAG: 30S ribosomal protein S9 [Bacteroidota bacterium]